ncbi:MAG TPA: cobalamin B12-binding domain-containing protein [Alkalispirochaeta sp.]|nr:cobalamin B12-binding domain-containing protein [Alkalispirochaeta sp.]
MQESARDTVRIVIAKPGLDGHDRGAKYIARALRDAGYEVIYTGIRQTPEAIVDIAIQEDVQFVGLSLLSGAHMALFPRVVDLLREQDAEDIIVFGGGIIPAHDVYDLQDKGVRAVFPPGTPIQAVIDFIEETRATPAVEPAHR